MPSRGNSVNLFPLDGFMDAGIVCWDLKYFYFNPCPSQADAEIKTLTGIPNFPAYTSGHSTFSGAAATVLSHLLPAVAASLMTWHWRLPFPAYTEQFITAVIVKPD